MAYIKKKSERKFKITVCNGYKVNGQKRMKAQTITVPSSVPKRGIQQYVMAEAERIEKKFKYTGNGKILVAAVQRGYSIVLPEHEPPVFIKGGLHGKLVMFKGEVLLGCAIVRIFRADMFECCQQRHLPFAGLQTSRQQGQKWRRGLQRTGRCMVCRTR